MNKLLYLNEFSKRISKANEIEDVARLSAFIAKKIFNARFFAFFIKQDESVTPIYIDSQIGKLDFNLLFSYEVLISAKNESCIRYLNDVDSRSPIYLLLKSHNADCVILQSIACEHQTDMIISFVGNGYTQDNLEYFESFSNIIKLKLGYIFSTKKIHELLSQTKNILDSTLRVLSNLSEIKDFYTQGHMNRVAIYSKNIALSLDLKNVDVIEQAALLHDIGKVGIPDAILLKPMKLSQQEYNFIKKHPEFSEFILSEIKGFEKVVKIIRSHHEYLDGSGYPDGLKSDCIPIESRILTIADVFDALTTDRPYRKALNCAQAIEIMFSEFASKLDMDILKRSIEVLMESKKTVNAAKIYDEQVQIESMRNMIFYIDYETNFYSKHYLPKFAHNLNEDVVMVLLDLQDMRTINFNYSRLIGDKLIRSFSESVKYTFEKTQSEFFRIGGDSFLVIIKKFDIDLLPNYIFGLDKNFKNANTSINPSFWFACCQHKKDDDISNTLQLLTKKIFYKRRVS